MPERLTDTCKDGFDWVADFEKRTAEAIAQRGDDTAPLGNVADMAGAHRMWCYDALVNNGTLSVLLHMAPYLLSLRNYRLLEIGCGYGRDAPFLSMFDCVRYVGIDITAARIEYAKKRYDAGWRSFQCADATTWRGDEPFDVAVCMMVLQHVPRPEKLAIIETIKQALKPDGVVLLWEGKILDGGADQHYVDEACPAHMIPVDFDELAEAFKPWVLERSAGCFYVARQGAAE